MNIYIWTNGFFCGDFFLKKCEKKCEKKIQCKILRFVKEKILLIQNENVEYKKKNIGMNTSRKKIKKKFKIVKISCHKKNVMVFLRGQC
jgi:hypothetical protein